jgi:hypothetical protein
VRAVWRSSANPKSGENKPGEVFYVGLERRNLRPFIQMPVHRTSKELVEKFKVAFKGTASIVRSTTSDPAGRAPHARRRILSRRSPPRESS